VKAQNVLGQFEDAKSLVNTPSALGVILMPVTPALMPKDPSLLSNATNHVDSSDRPTAFSTVSSVQSESSRKTSKGNIFTSAKEVLFSSALVCLFAC